MRIIFIGLLGLTTWLSSCSKDPSCMSQASIIGFDYRKCACCGGYEFTIDNVSPANGNGFFLAGSLPANFSIGDHPQFPVRVLIEWKRLPSGCSQDLIQVTRIRRL